MLDQFTQNTQPMNFSDLFAAQNLGLQPNIPALMSGVQSPQSGPQNVQVPPQLQHIGDVINQYVQDKQTQADPGVVGQILSQRFQPTLADTSRSVFESNQNGPGNYVSPEQIAQQRGMRELTPYTANIEMQTQAANLQKMQQANQLQGLTGLPAAQADIALKNAQTNFFNNGGQGGIKPEPVFDSTLNGGQGGFRFAMANELRQNPNLMPASSVPAGAKLSAFNAAPSPKAQQIFSDANLDPRVPPLTADEQKDNEADYKDAVKVHDAAVAASGIASRAIEPAKNYAGGVVGNLASYNAALPEFMQNQSLQNTQLLNKYSGQIAMQLAQQSKGIRLGVGMEKFARSTTIDPNNSMPVNNTIIQNIQAMPALTLQQKNMEAYLKQLSPQYKEAVRDQFYNDYPMMIDDPNSDVAQINPAFKDQNLFRKWISGNIQAPQGAVQQPMPDAGISLPGSANTGGASHRFNPATGQLEQIQ